MYSPFGPSTPRFGFRRTRHVASRLMHALYVTVGLTVGIMLLLAGLVVGIASVASLVGLVSGVAWRVFTFVAGV